ncbi:glycoside hydrolase family 43 protein [Belliella marina]|uniref:Glycoside hydrolase family 43 protein n=1 Tax=Belliella marina TaxID=1644146 RepID=A0ABW4VKQ9_9BACT
MLYRKITWLVCILFLQTSILIGQTTFKNPVITGMNPDPSICRVGDDFYLVTSTFEYFPGLPIYHSKDLVNWKLVGHALSRQSNNPLMGASSSGGNFAPAIRYHDGTFYISCTNYGGKGSEGVFYVTATDPAGDWSDPVWVGNWFVDPSMMFANDSLYWISPNNKGDFSVGTFDPNAKKFVEPLQLVASGLGGASPEAPHMYKINDYYYLISAEGGTGYEHRSVIQRSTSPYGPFEPSPYNPVISNMDNPESPFQAIGHSDFVQLQDGSWWLVCLGIRPIEGNYHHLGRETFLAPITWTPDGWPIAGDRGVMLEEFPVPNLPEHIWEKESVRDDFDSSDLRLLWNFLRNPHDTDWSLTENLGYLRLNGSKISFREKDSPAFVARRQTAFNMAASTKVNFTPVAPNEEAGLVIRGNDENHLSLVITMRDGKRVAMYREFLKGDEKDTEVMEISEGDITLRITASESQYEFWVQEEGKPAVSLGTSPTKVLSTEVLNGFTGVYIGMYASGNGSANTNPADFDWFDFEEDLAMPYKWISGVEESVDHGNSSGN